VSVWRRFTQAHADQSRGQREEDNSVNPRKANNFTFAAIVEVAVLFAASSPA
jgi:hypothetical protein